MKRHCVNPLAAALMHDAACDINSLESLLLGACAAAAHKMEDVSVGQVDARIDRLAQDVADRVHGPQPQALLAHLHQVLFEEQGFGGDPEQYFLPTQNFLPSVLETKRGNPAVLSLVYRLVAERLGLRAWGVILPGHFLCGLSVDGPTMVIDSFHGGRMLTRDELAAGLEKIHGTPFPACDLNLSPVCNLHWLTRILQNLLTIFGAAGNYADVAAMLELEMILWPDQVHLHRDVALAYAKIGMSEPARERLAHYLDRVPGDPQRDDLRQLLGVLAA